VSAEAFVRGATPSEVTLPGQRDESVIGDGHPVRIAGEIAQDVLGSAKWPFAIDTPFFAVRLPNQLSEHLGCPSGFGAAVKAQLRNASLKPR
jgi:hypothetical protein